MTDKDFKIVNSKIDQEKEYLKGISEEIFNTPELSFKEVNAHAVLTSALSKHNFTVEKHYLLETAFRAEYSVKAGGPTIAVLLEYDALPDMGHACGHNLISEAGLACGIAVKQAMDEDKEIAGKIVVLGTPAEEFGGGKIRLIELGAFKNIDAAIMVHPTPTNVPHIYSAACIHGSVVFKGKESHAAASPWFGINALDAAIVCYNNISVLRQQLKPTNRVLVIIKEGGIATNIIPAKTKMELSIRTTSLGELKHLKSRVESCINAAATATGCTVEYSFEESNAYQNVLSNRVMSDLYKNCSERLGIKYEVLESSSMGATDMGNVSHVVPSAHPHFAIPIKGNADNHTKEFTACAGSPEAQNPTLIAGKALALTCLSIFRNKELLEKAKKQFKEDVFKDMQS